MVEIHVHKAPDGWRSYIVQGRKMTVVDGLFDSKDEALSGSQSATEYLFGT
ncbi:MAG TPA: hypothetical protein VLG37_05520 [Candidatus Saccharimonadales bacterium]|nr:hypothetical protein [Candidatus Saccharimonadales bacterium]